MVPVGVEISTPPAAVLRTEGTRFQSWLTRLLPAGLRTHRAFVWLAVASVASNVMLVVTGGAVRLTNSGLGCPTWPSCGAGSLVPVNRYAAYGVIEFTNRMLTFVLAAVAILTWLVAMQRREQRRLATVAALGIPAQAVLGGITVLTELNPWLVACHFLLSAALIATTYLLWWRSAHPATDGQVSSSGTGPPSTAAWPLAVLTTISAAAVLVLGTVVTGSGPHAGALQSNHRVHRTGLNVASMAQLHADSVMVLIGLTIGLVAMAIATRLNRMVRTAALGLLGIELAQGAIGYAQYFLHVPPLLVGFHMLGACLVWLAALRVLFFTSAGRPSS